MITSAGQNHAFIKKIHGKENYFDSSMIKKRNVILLQHSLMHSFLANRIVSM